MVNRQKMRGDRYERDVLAKCHDHGLTAATRTRPGRNEDQGDIHLDRNATYIVQAKDAVTPTWRDWLHQLDLQRRRAGAEYGFLALKRRGTGGRPPIHLAVMPLDDMLDLVRRLADLERSVHTDQFGRPSRSDGANESRGREQGKQHTCPDPVARAGEGGVA